MRAVNLIPKESRGVRLATSSHSGGAVYAVVGLLVVALAFVTVYVLDTNTINSRRVTLATLRTQAAQAQATATRLAPYSQFATLAEERVATVRGIASARFDWHRALEDLAQVMPSDSSLQSLVGTVAPGAASGSSASLRGDITSPAFEISGCTRTQDDVANLISRLRTMPGVSRVSLESSAEGTGGSAAGSSGGCPAGSPAFALVVWFQPLPDAGPDGVTSVSATAATAGATP